MPYDNGNLQLISRLHFLGGYSGRLFWEIFDRHFYDDAAGFLGRPRLSFSFSGTCPRARHQSRLLNFRPAASAASLAAGSGILGCSARNSQSFSPMLPGRTSGGRGVGCWGGGDGAIVKRLSKTTL
jgi:hypothetical protein